MAKEIKHDIWKLCRDCTIRNCRKEPKLKTGGFYCNKLRVYKAGPKMYQVVRFVDKGYSKNISVKGG